MQGNVLKRPLGRRCEIALSASLFDFNFCYASWQLERGIAGADRIIVDHSPSKGISGHGQPLLNQQIKADATKTSVANRMYSIVNRVQSLVRDVR